MGAGRVTREVEAVRIATELRGILIDPCHGATDLVGHRHEIPIRVVHRHEIDRDEVRSGGDEHFGRIGGIFGRSATPRATV